MQDNFLKVSCQSALICTNLTNCTKKKLESKTVIIQQDIILKSDNRLDALNKLN